MELFIDQFRRMPEDELDPNLTPEEREQILKFKVEGAKLKKAISPRHMFMIAMATGIGTGLLVGSGTSLHKGGPAGLVIGTIIIGSMVLNVMDAAGEMAVAYGDLTGGFNAYTSILIDKSFAFSVSWNYFIQWIIVLPLELVTASITIKYWNQEVNSDAFVVIFYVFTIIVSFYGSKGYGEVEWLFNLFKVLMIIGFCIYTVILTCGGVGDAGYIGAKYWHDPGAFPNGFKGVCSVFVSIAFALGCTEMIALNASEQSNPRRAIPSASKQVFYKILFMFLLPLFMIGLVVPYNSDQLLGASSKTGTSPFVIATSLYKPLSSIVNAVILLAVCSVGNSAVFAGSRTLQSLAEQGYAPKYFNYIDRTGKPLRALVLCLFVGLLSFIAAYKDQSTVFDWLLALSGLSQLLSWSSIVLSHIRFRTALRAQGLGLNDLGYKAKFGEYGSWYAFIIIVLAFIAQFYVALFPIGAEPNPTDFFQQYLGIVVAILFYAGHKIWTKNWQLFIPASQIDLTVGRKHFDAEELAQEDLIEMERLKNSPFHVKLFNFFC